MSDYQVTLHLWKSVFPGHMAVEFQGPDGRREVVSFGPTSLLGSI